MYLRLITIFGFIIFLSGNIFACMCGSTSVCAAYQQATAVVVAEIIDIQPAQIPLDRIFADSSADKFETGQKVTLKISKWYKGALEKRFVKLIQQNSTCDWSFEESDKNSGKQYLFYLSRSKKYKDYSIITCGRSSVLESAVDDVSWLIGLPGSLRRTRISGETFLSKEDNSFPRLSSTKITIKGAGSSYSLLTDENGLYQIWDVPPGKYTVSATTPPNLILGWTTSVPNNWTYFWNLDKPEPRALVGQSVPGPITAEVQKRFFDVVKNGNDPNGWLKFI